MLDKVWDWVTRRRRPARRARRPTPVTVAGLAAPSNRPRQTPGRRGGGSGGGGGGDLVGPARRACARFATGSQGANDSLRPRAGAPRADYADFRRRCRWGTLDAVGRLHRLRRLADGERQRRRVGHDRGRTRSRPPAVRARSRPCPTAPSRRRCRPHHVDVSRQDLAIDAAAGATALPPTTGYADDPVNTATGNFLEVETDLAFPGAASALDARPHATTPSDRRPAHAFGPGWSSVGDAGLTSTRPGRPAPAALSCPTAARSTSPASARAGTGRVGESLWLARADGLGRPARHRQRRLLVAPRPAAARCSSYGTGPESSRSFVELARDDAGPGRPARRTPAASGSASTGPTADDDRVVAARSADGRTVTYAYDADGRLRLRDRRRRAPAPTAGTTTA